MFRNSVTEADVLPATISTVKAKTGLKNVAVLYGNDDVFTKSGYDNFKKALKTRRSRSPRPRPSPRATWTSRPS